ncbi:hypothetical protein GW756_01645 [bacterium]|nr:hypothetical protein [bacterium]NCQ55058.1 hypothetical protein [Candidatus Parcubacteria bacterium]NCS67102.1 hypothetical protein [Candidatus Peregrinibacteria bacterium]NCS96048.1 hypothetical protein [bacterium]
MTDQVTAAAPKVEALEKAKVEVERYPAMQFVVKFSKLVATVIAVLFLLFALMSIITGIFNEDASFLWGLVNAGFYILVGGVLIGLIKGMGEAFEVLLDLEKRK